MSVIGFGQGQQYGMNTVVYGFQSAFMWNGPFTPVFWNANIAAGTVDAGNSPTTVLRMGLVMGRQAATGLWTNYLATNTDGSEVAQGILTIGYNMTNYLTGTTQPLFWGVCVGGCVKPSQLIGLDGMAREQLAKQFLFDDDLPGRAWFPYRRFQTKLANYQLLLSDNQTEFNNLGATGQVQLTLPPIANGLLFAFRCYANQNMQFLSYEKNVLGGAGNIIGSTLTNGTVGITTSTQIGGGVRVYSNPAATQWEVENISSYNQVVSFT